MVRGSSRAACGVLGLALALPCAAAEIRDELAAVEKQVYDALEAVPIRGWADQSVLRPLSDLRHELRTVPRGSEAEKQLLRNLPRAWSAIQERFLRTLRLVPVATVAFDRAGVPRAQLARGPADLVVGVPAAVVLLVGKVPNGGTLRITRIDPDGRESPGVEVRLFEHFRQAVAIPVTPADTAGRRSVELTLRGPGGGSKLALPVAVGRPGVLTGTVAREGGTTAQAAKVFVEDDRGRLYVVPGGPVRRTQSWYAPWQPQYSYVDGAFRLPLPPGEYRVTAMKGNAWRPWCERVRIQAGQATPCRIRLRPLRDIEAGGWLCGDMHTHTRRGPTLLQMRAEDVNVATRTLYASRRSVPMPTYPEDCDATHLVTSNQEVEHWKFGNVFYFNIPRTVTDPPGGKPEWAPMFHYDEQAHALGGITARWLRGRPFSAQWHGQSQPELAVSAALGHMDVWGVLENSMQNLLDDPRRKWNGAGWGGRLYETTYRTWYALLNCGLRIPPSAGTSYGRLSRLGFNRVYAKVRGKLTTASWAAALKRGDGFVTNGPLLWLSAGRAGRPADRLPGERLDLDRPGKVTLRVELASAHPVRSVQVLRNGRVVWEKPAGDVGQPTAWEFEADADAPCWFAARCFGEHLPRYVHHAAHNQFAHTSPLFVTLRGSRPRSPADAARFVKEIDALIAFAPKLATESLRRRATAAYSKARAYFASQAGGAAP